MAHMKRIGLLAVLAATTLIAGVADAGRYRGGRGTVTTPYGTANVNSPEWKQSGGNFMVYQQIMQRKQMMLQQRAIMKQRQAFLKQQQKREKAQPSNPVAARPAVASKMKKKRPAQKADPELVSSPKAKSMSKTTEP